jgi:uncharacterized protein (TIRG00374 family)
MKIATINGRNVFFMFGFLALAGMAWVIGYDVIWSNILKTGWWFVAIIGMWLPIYLVNTWSLNLIIRDENPENRTVPFLHIFKINISGFALKAATPLGFIGGDPYKILELKRFYGLEKATSAVVLYTMTHISAQFLFWALSIVAAALFLPMPGAWNTSLLISFFCFCLVLWLLWKGYRNGMTVVFFDFISRIPLLKRKVLPFCEKYSNKFVQIDEQISHLYYHRRKTFLQTLALEFIARTLNCLEVYIILRSAAVDATLIQSVAIYAFMSLFTNILFFSPMQLGTREGGFILAFSALGFPGSIGIYVSLVTRLRELAWIGIGVLFMKVGSGFMPPCKSEKS